MTRAVSAAQQSWLRAARPGQDRTGQAADDRRATCTLCVMGTTSALQADAHGFAVSKLGLDTYDRVPSEGLLGWRFVGLRPFQGGSCRLILSWSRSYLELRLPAGQSTVLENWIHLLGFLSCSAILGKVAFPCCALVSPGRQTTYYFH